MTKQVEVMINHQTLKDEIVESGRRFLQYCREDIASAYSEWKKDGGLFYRFKTAQKRRHLDPAMARIRANIEKLATELKISRMAIPFVLVLVEGTDIHSVDYLTDCGITLRQLKEIRELSNEWEPFKDTPTGQCPVCNGITLSPSRDVCVYCGSYLRIPRGMLDLLFPTWLSLNEAFLNEVPVRSAGSKPITQSPEARSLATEFFSGLSSDSRPVSDAACRSSLNAALKRAERLREISTEEAEFITQSLVESIDVSWLIPAVERSASARDFDDHFKRQRSLLELLARLLQREPAKLLLVNVAREFLEQSAEKSSSAIQAIEANRSTMDGRTATRVWADLMQSMAPYLRSIFMSLDLLDRKCPYGEANANQFGSRVQIMVREGLFRCFQPNGLKKFTAIASYIGCLWQWFDVEAVAESVWPWAACISLRDRRSVETFRSFIPLRDERWSDSEPDFGVLATNYRMFISGKCAVYDSTPPPIGYHSIPVQYLAAGVEEMMQKGYWNDGMNAIPFFRRWPKGVEPSGGNCAAT